MWAVRGSPLLTLFGSSSSSLVLSFARTYLRQKLPILSHFSQWQQRSSLCPDTVVRTESVWKYLISEVINCQEAKKPRKPRSFWTFTIFGHFWRQHLIIGPREVRWAPIACLRFSLQHQNLCSVQALQTCICITYICILFYMYLYLHSMYLYLYYMYLYSSTNFYLGQLWEMQNVK